MRSPWAAAQLDVLQDSVPVSSFLIIIYLWGWSGAELLLLRPLTGLLYEPWMINGDDRGAIGGVPEWHRKRKYSEKTCPSAIWSTTDPV
jgi:hypothetical protein